MSVSAVSVRGGCSYPSSCHYSGCVLVRSDLRILCTNTHTHTHTNRELIILKQYHTTLVLSCTRTSPLATLCTAEADCQAVGQTSLRSKRSLIGTTGRPTVNHGPQQPPATAVRSGLTTAARIRNTNSQYGSGPRARCLGSMSHPLEAHLRVVLSHLIEEEGGANDSKCVLGTLYSVLKRQRPPLIFS